MYFIKKIAIVFLLSISILACKEEKKDEAALAAAKADSLKKAETTKNEVYGVARIEPQDGITNLYAGTSGRVLTVLIDENQTLAKGQTIATIDVDVEKAQLAQAESRIETQNAAVAANKATINALKVGLQNAQDTYNRNLALYQGGGQIKQVLDDSKAAVDRYQKDIETAEANMAQTSVRMKELQADIAFYKTALNQKRVLTMMSGRVLKVNVNPGDYVNATTQLAEFAPAGGLVAKTEVDELYADRVEIGQKGYLMSQTTGDTLATGTVIFAAEYLKQKSLFKDQATELEDRRVREVHIKVEGSKRLLIGSRVDCLIKLL